jgi:sugar phosphate isomerase/epimerase
MTGAMLKSRGTIMQRLNAYFPDVGFSTNVLDNPADVLSAVKLLSPFFNSLEIELGNDAEKTMYQSEDHRYAEIVEGIKVASDKNNTTLSVHAPYLGIDANLSSPDFSIRAQSITRLRRAIEIAYDLGAKKVTFHPGYRGQSNENSKDYLLRSLEMITSKDITLCLENMGAERSRYIVFSGKEHEDICNRTGIKIALDVIHLMSIAIDDKKFWEEMEIYAPLIGNIHMADMNRPKHIHIPIGEGNLQLSVILNFIASRGYRGAAIIEEFGGDFSTEYFIDRGRMYKSLVDKNRSTVLQRAA